MDTKKVLLIINPVAGKSMVRENLVGILQILTREGWRVECYPTQGQGDARNLVRDCRDDFDFICCAGGDGTLDEVLCGMMENPYQSFIPIGYIPAGTTNDFASTLQIPSDMLEAARVITAGNVFSCDVGRFNQDQYFTYVAAFGLFTDTSYETPQEWKNVFGHAAYILQGALSLGRIRTWHVHVKSDDRDFSDDIALGLVTNSRSVGGFPNLAGNHVDLTDGQFEVTLIRLPANPAEINDMIVALTSMDFDASEMIYHFKTGTLSIECDEKISWTRDGEYAGDYEKVEIAALRQQLKILVPENAI